MEKDDDKLNRTFFDIEIKKLNDALPKSRRSLLELLKETHPSYTNLGGEVVELDRKELNDIAKLVREDKRGGIYLPFIIIRETAFRKGEFLIQGNDAEVEVVNSVLRHQSNSRTIFRPDVIELTKTCPTLIVFGYQFSG
jgi:uncharacterized protein (UPF0216 family)